MVRNCWRCFEFGINGVISASNGRCPPIRLTADCPFTHTCDSYRAA